eukprot:s1049_g11.t1
MRLFCTATPACCATMFLVAPTRRFGESAAKKSCDAVSIGREGTQSCDWHWPAAQTQREMWHQSCQLIGGFCEVGLPYLGVQGT